MKKILIPAAAIIFLLSSCVKKPGCSFNPCGVIAPASDIQAMQSYLNSNGISASQHCSGLYYLIDSAGTGKTAEACSSIMTTYTGRLTNGTVFDQQNMPVNITLGYVIQGWRIGLPLIKEGGFIHLYIPPSLGYGNQQVGTIPPNSILIFDIKLIAVQ